MSGQRQIWIANYDGTGQAQVPITLPANVEFNTWPTNSASLVADEAHVRLSPDGQTLFFETITDPTGSRIFSIYSCDLSGNNLTEIIALPAGEEPMTISGAY